MPWKLSEFNLESPGADTVVFFNALSGQALALSPSQAREMRYALESVRAKGACRDLRLFRALVALGYVVPTDLDERSHESARFRAIQESEEQLLLAIAPTLACNLRCTYCFQQNFRTHGMMSPAIQRGLVAFVRAKATRVKRMSVQWFGGEPLLALRVIDRLTDEFRRACDERGIEYSADILTNGTMMTPAFVRSIERLKIRSVQIPLDGSVEMYAKRKGVSLAYAQDVYEALLVQMQALVDASGSVIVRINVDRENPEAGREVVRMFYDRGIRDRRLDFRLGFINTERGVIDCVPHDCFSNSEFATLEDDFRLFLAEHHYTVYGAPQSVNYLCIAPLRNAYAVDPLGRIGKCVPAIGTSQSVYARIHPDDVGATLREADRPDYPYAWFNPYQSVNCARCPLVPTCLGSCPKKHEEGAVFECREVAGLHERLEFFARYAREHEEPPAPNVSRPWSRSRRQAQTT